MINKVYMTDSTLKEKELKVLGTDLFRSDLILVDVGNGTYEQVSARSLAYGGRYSYFRKDGLVYLSAKPVPSGSQRLDKLRLEDRISFILADKFNNGAFFLERKSESSLKSTESSYKEMKARVFIFRDPDRLHRFLLEEDLWEDMVKRVDAEVERRKEKVREKKTLTEDEKKFLSSQQSGSLEEGKTYYVSYGQQIEKITIKEKLLESGNLYLLDNGRYFSWCYGRIYNMPPLENMRPIPVIADLADPNNYLEDSLEEAKDRLKTLKSFFDDPWKKDTLDVRVLGKSKIMKSIKKKYNYRIFIE